MPKSTKRKSAYDKVLDKAEKKFRKLDTENKFNGLSDEQLEEAWKNIVKKQVKKSVKKFKRKLIQAGNTLAKDLLQPYKENNMVPHNEAEKIVKEHRDGMQIIGNTMLQH